MTSTLSQRRFSSAGSYVVCCLLVIATLVCASPAWAQGGQPPAAPAQPQHAPILVVRNPSGETTTISPQQFAELPRTSFQAKMPHSEQTATYAGVLLGHVLQEAGVEPTSKSKDSQELARPLRSAYVLVEAADGYQVVFSLPEVFPELEGRDVLLADRENGRPLDAKAGPYRIVVAQGAGYERWVRQVRRILVQPGTASPFPSRPLEVPEKTASAETAGKLYLVGTGPGAPDLITVRAARILRNADLVLCYSWMKDELAPFVRPGVVEVMSPLLQGGRYFGQKPEEFSEGERSSAPTSST